MHNTSYIELNFPPHSLSLNNVLHAPFISIFIVSISQFCLDNNAIIDFSSNCFSVNEKSIEKILLQGPIKQGVYEVRSVQPTACSSKVSPKVFSFYIID